MKDCMVIDTRRQDCKKCDSPVYNCERDECDCVADYTCAQCNRHVCGDCMHDNGLCTDCLPNEQEIDNKNYFVFVMGYDLLQKDIMSGEVRYKECDLVYECLGIIYDAFAQSDYCKNSGKSEYEALSDFLHNEIQNVLDTLNGADWGGVPPNEE